MNSTKQTMLQNIKWDVFTREERDIIENLVARGEFQAITRAISVDSSEKEYWISKIMEDVKPVGAPIESKVLAELAVEKSKGNEIDTPEKEAEWQEKIESEKQAHEAKVRGRRKKEVKILEPKEEVQDKK